MWSSSGQTFGLQHPALELLNSALTSNLMFASKINETFYYFYGRELALVVYFFFKSNTRFIIDINSSANRHNDVSAFIFAYLIRRYVYLATN